MDPFIFQCLQVHSENLLLSSRNCYAFIYYHLYMHCYATSYAFIDVVILV